jgi:hypothetical protein
MRGVNAAQAKEPNKAVWNLMICILSLSHATNLAQTDQMTAVQRSRVAIHRIHPPCIYAGIGCGQTPFQYIRASENHFFKPDDQLRDSS